MGLITSMNLQEYSQTHDWKMGIRFSKKEDPEIYVDIVKDLSHLTTQTIPYLKNTSADDSKHKKSTSNSQNPVKKTVYKPTEAPNKGIIDKILDTVTGEAAYCIRCGKGMPKFDMQKPYCDKCYASWARYKNPKYKEKFCHACGSDSTKSVISFEKPTCKDCFKDYFK
jgi:hypothetical protein